eukprot:713520-Hanusia_phi.AAC.4
MPGRQPPAASGAWSPLSLNHTGRARCFVAPIFSSESESSSSSPSSGCSGALLMSTSWSCPLPSCKPCAHSLELSEKSAHVPHRVNRTFIRACSCRQGHPAAANQRLTLEKFHTNGSLLDTSRLPSALPSTSILPCSSYEHLPSHLP